MQRHGPPQSQPSPHRGPAHRAPGAGAWASPWRRRRRGETRRGREKLYSLLSSSQNPYRGSGDDDNKPATVADFFADPPDWLPKQLKVYRENPALHLKPLCAAVAAVVLGDSVRGDEVREEVERVLEEGEVV